MEGTKDESLRNIAKGILVVGLIGAACVFMGAYDGPQKLVERMHGNNKRLVPRTNRNEPHHEDLNLPRETLGGKPRSHYTR